MATEAAALLAVKVPEVDTAAATAAAAEVAEAVATVKPVRFLLRLSRSLPASILSSSSRVRVLSKGVKVLVWAKWRRTELDGAVAGSFNRTATSPSWNFKLLDRGSRW